MHSPKLAAREIKLYETLTYGPHVSHGYCIKLQNARYIYYMKNHCSTHYSVGLAHACPHYDKCTWQGQVLVQAKTDNREANIVNNR